MLIIVHTTVVTVVLSALGPPEPTLPRLSQGKRAHVPAGVVCASRMVDTRLCEGDLRSDQSIPAAQALPKSKILQTGNGVSEASYSLLRANKSMVTSCAKHLN